MRKQVRLKKIQLEFDLEKQTEKPDFALRKDIAQMSLDLLNQKLAVREEQDPEKKKELQSFVPVLQDTIKELEESLKK